MEYEQELKDLEELRLLKDQQGGKVLKQWLESALATDIHKLAMTSSEPLAADIRAKLSLYEKITGLDDKIENIKSILNKE